MFTGIYVNVTVNAVPEGRLLLLAGWYRLSLLEPGIVYIMSARFSGRPPGPNDSNQPG